MLDTMDLDRALLRSTIAATRALDDKLRTIGWYTMHGHPLTDHRRYLAVADHYEVEGLRRDRVRVEATR